MTGDGRNSLKAHGFEPRADAFTYRVNLINRDPL